MSATSYVMSENKDFTCESMDQVRWVIGFSWTMDDFHHFYKKNGQNVKCAALAAGSFRYPYFLLHEHLGFQWEPPFCLLYPTKYPPDLFICELQPSHQFYFNSLVSLDFTFFALIFLEISRQ